MASEAWLINPGKRKKRTKSKRRRNPTTGAYMKANPRKRRSTRKRSVRRNPVAAAPRRRRRRAVLNAGGRRRRFRRNPPAMKSILTDLVPVTSGFLATKFVGNMLTPTLAQFLPGNGGPLMRIATKVGLAYLTAWGAEQFMGKKFFMPVMLGGSLEAIQDLTREFISPMFPALQAYEYPLNSYFEPPPVSIEELPSPEEIANGNSGGNGIGSYYNNGYRSMG